MTNELRFFTGMHHPHNAHCLPAACISINALARRKGPFVPPVDGWMLDSGAFKTIEKYGYYPDSPTDYAIKAIHWAHTVGNLKVIVSQDYMCEPFVLTRTGLDIPTHQRLTIERYDELLSAWRVFGSTVPIMPVLQGFSPQDYVDHIRQYGTRLATGMWVGVGSVCKRQGDPSAIRSVLRAIKTERPDLRLHGFGVKLTALKDRDIREMLYSADSMAWSFSARKQGRDANSPLEAYSFHLKVMSYAQ